jgi:hypothetical protein
MTADEDSDQSFGAEAGMEIESLLQLVRNLPPSDSKGCCPYSGTPGSGDSAK